MINLTLAFFLLFCFTANASLINNCTEPPAQFPLDLSQFAGRWFVLASNNNDSVPDCSQLNKLFNPGNNNKAIAETIKYIKFVFYFPKIINESKDSFDSPT